MPYGIFKVVLRYLRIKDFAIIDLLTIDFEPGLNVLTGETGAGKSIIVDALGLALGERAHPDMMRAGRDETSIEACFDLPDRSPLEKLGIHPDDILILRRSLYPSGRSRAFINDTSVNVQTLLEFGRSLVDIHGQHEHQSLLSNENQRTILDAFGKLGGERSEVERLFHGVQALVKELSIYRSDAKEKAQRIDLLGFQVNEIDSAALQPGEKEALIGEKAILSNLARLNELTDSTYNLLYSGDGSSNEKLSMAVALLKEASRTDGGLSGILQLLESALPLVEDAAVSLRQYKGNYDADPGRLDFVEERLELIKKLERKYGEGVDGILRHREDAAKELQRISLSDEKVKELESELEGKERRLCESAAGLSARRKETSEKVEGAVRFELKELAMEKAEFRIDIKPDEISASGADSVEFLFSANKGEPVKPLGRAASGGELSRIMLALKGILAESDSVPVLIFDEVDAGIGGATAKSVGARLKRLGKKRQVLCITHLAQIAAMADNHIMVEKEDRREGVCVKLKRLLPPQREEEIARMLSGKVTDASKRHARELLEKG